MNKPFPGHPDLKYYRDQVGCMHAKCYEARPDPAFRIVQAFARTIDKARSVLYAGGWDEEIQTLGPLLDAAAAPGIETHVAIYGTRTLSGPTTYDLSECGASARLRLAGRRLAVVVADDSEAVVAEFGDRTPDQVTHAALCFGGSNEPKNLS